MNKDKNIWKLNRIADDDIYLNEDRYKKPKISFMKLKELLKNKKNSSFLDIGCATGELIYYLKSQLPDLSYQGLDVSENLLERARNNLTNIDFIQQDIILPYSDWEQKPKADIVAMLGVLSIFDDFKIILDNLISCTKQNGLIFVMMNYTYDPIDVLVRYRKTGSNEWESGWNTFSKKSIKNFLDSKSFIKSYTWHDFDTNIIVPKKKDPMRKWTSMINGKLETVVGTGQIIYQTILEIKI